ncbi:uncharacterized protein LOC111031373 isoform X2 [Myzus persicae]|nr:uncharacterized protein LOC111031373 isoform X2 [Myzus persicae]
MMLTLQFENYNEFINYVKSMDITGTENKGYLNTLYSQICSKKSHIEGSIFTPKEYCDYALSKENDECEQQIKDFKYESGRTVFKYYENNKYKNLVTSYAITLFGKGKSVFKKMLDMIQLKKCSNFPVLQKMTEYARDYFIYHTIIFEEYFKVFNEFVPYTFCTTNGEA